MRARIHTFGLQIKQLEALEVAELEQSDYVLNIRLTGEQSVKVWRRVKVSGGLSLAVLADKVITPLMGWTRNYHAHVWTDTRDGSSFGPKDCMAVDMMWMTQLGWESVPETKCKVAHLWRKPGDVAEWMYDLGDHWEHDVTCKAIRAPTESDGKVEVLEGFGACPREDGHGASQWKDDLATLRSGNPQKKQETLAQIYNSMNYAIKGWMPWTNPQFDHARFEQGEAVERIKDALSLPLSYRKGSKSLIMPLAPNALETHAEWRKGKKVHTLNTPTDGGYIIESTTGKRDGVSARACAMCGTPHNLRV
ncbi:hypothetical protein FRB90_001555 [Tulasnella sp. 427]|nr:hypothetical protein FRB90_001555 [Tulasnella sp. 427]